MRKENTRSRGTKLVMVGALALGVMGGSYGIATAASNSESAGGTAAAAATPAAPSQQRPWGGQRSDESLLSGDAASKVSAAAKARVSGGTIVRVETDADGHAKYEAHMTDANGSPVTVYVDANFDVVSVESR